MLRTPYEGDHREYHTCNGYRVDIKDGANPPGAKADECTAPSSVTANTRSMLAWIGGWQVPGNRKENENKALLQE